MKLFLAVVVVVASTTSLTNVYAADKVYTPPKVKATCLIKASTLQTSEVCRGLSLQQYAVVPKDSKVRKGKTGKIKAIKPKLPVYLHIA